MEERKMKATLNEGKVQEMTSKAQQHKTQQTHP